MWFHCLPNLYKRATFYLFLSLHSVVNMSWLCSVCEKSFSRKDSMQRHAMSKHSNAGVNPFQTVP